MVRTISILPLENVLLDRCLIVFRLASDLGCLAYSVSEFGQDFAAAFAVVSISLGSLISVFVDLNRHYLHD